MILELPAAKFNPWEQDLIKDSVDLEIECPGKSFFVHKVILLAKGLFFEKLKSSTASTKKPTLSLIKLDDDPTCIKILLRYCYDGMHMHQIYEERTKKDDEEVLFKYLILLYEMFSKYCDFGPHHRGVKETFKCRVDAFVLAAREEYHDRTRPKFKIEQIWDGTAEEYWNTTGYKLTPAGVVRTVHLLIESTRRSMAVGRLREPLEIFGDHTGLLDLVLAALCQDDVLRQNDVLYSELANVDEWFWRIFTKFEEIAGKRPRTCSRCRKKSSQDLINCYFDPDSRKTCPHCSRELDFEGWNNDVQSRPRANLLDYSEELGWWALPFFELFEH
ncbi:hypothetical protein HDK90DRAFT_55173 [Phyllosticta capitalensis]|uniref:BTB domain-containing protein n=1 Tax=Phyllosticta capitalensis TaxID=121624 RepID=A0ABR1YF82_9PEZI